MAISKTKKATMIGDYADKMAKSQAVVVTEYRGLTVSAITELRQRLREVGGNFQIVKNTLFVHMLEQAGVPVPEGKFEGPTALSFCFREVQPVVKTLMDYAGENNLLVIKATLWGTAVLDFQGTKALATMPPREIVLGQLLGAVQGPMVNIASILAAPLRELAQVLAARGEQAEEAA